MQRLTYPFELPEYSCKSTIFETPEPVLNELGLPEKDYYTTQDVCKVLKIKPDTFRYRLGRGHYPELKKVGGKRRFTIEEVTHLVDLTERFLKDHIFKPGR